MHVIQTFGTDGDLIDETDYTDREAAYAAYDEACRKADGRGKTAGVVMSETGTITNRHGTIPDSAQPGYRAPKIVRPEKTDASTDVQAQTAADDDVRERPGDENADAGTRGRAPDSGRGVRGAELAPTASLAPVTVAERTEPHVGDAERKLGPTVSNAPVTVAPKPEAPKPVFERPDTRPSSSPVAQPEKKSATPNKPAAKPAETKKDAKKP
jgi:hypothetical protein